MLPSDLDKTPTRRPQ